MRHGGACVAADDKRHARPMNVIDVWDSATFDAELLDQLESEAGWILRYFETDQRIFLEHDLGRNRSIVRPENPYAERFLRVTEAITRAKWTSGRSALGTIPG